MKRLTIIGIALLLCANVASAATNAEHGKVLYHTYCTQCHGVQGHGNGVNAARLSVQPRNHTDHSEMVARTDDELVKAIKDGGQAVNKSILMPNWDGNLSDNDIHDIVAYLRQLCCNKRSD